MKLLKNTQQIALVAVATVCLICLSSCQTATGATTANEKPHTSTENTNPKADLYRAMAEGVTKQCPVEVDKTTTLTKLEYKEEQHALAYTYLFSGGVYEDMNEQQWTVVQKASENMLKEQLRTNHLISQLKTDHLTLIYIYTDKNGKELFSVTLLPSEY